LAEITIYRLSLRAELQFEHSNWAEALTDLAARRKLLSTLSEAARDSYDQALAVEYIDQYDPLIRFSAYKLGRSESHDIDGVVKDIDMEMMEESVPGFGKLVEGLRGETGAEEMEKGRKTLEDVQFAGEKVEMRNAEIVEVMLRVQDSLGKLKGRADSGSGRGMKEWDKVLGVLGEAEGVARRLLDDHEVSLFLLGRVQSQLTTLGIGVKQLAQVYQDLSITLLGTPIHRLPTPLAPYTTRPALGRNPIFVQYSAPHRSDSVQDPRWTLKD
jgi:signal recognition particle subunit SRP68